MSLTGKTGQYQDKVPGLKNLPLSRYERIFKLYTEGKQGKQFYFYNILNKIEMPDNIDSRILDTYVVNTREPLTTTSYNIYGDIDSWWLLYLLNKDLLSKKFYAPPGTQLQYILPSSRELVYQQITNITIHNNKHF